MRTAKIFRILAAASLISLLAAALPATPVLAAEVISLDAYQGSIGQEITITGSGFYASETVSRGVNIIFGNSNPGDQIDYGIDIHEILKTHELETDGSFSTAFVVPDNLTGATLSEAVSNGAYYVYLTYYYPPPSLPNYSPNIEAIATFTVVSGEITIDPDDGTVGIEVEINGTGFGSGEEITVEYDGETIAISGDDDTNSSGAFGETTIIIPPSTAGEHTIKVIDEDPSVSAEVEFTVKPEITVSPASGTAGSIIQVSGTGFDGDEVVTISFGGQEVTQENTDSNGSFTVSFSPTLTAAGTYSIEADDGTNSEDGNFTITVTTLTISPTIGKADTQINVSGSGFLISYPITITFNDITVATTTSNSKGAFAASFKVPIPTTGTHTIAVTDGTSTNETSFIIESTGIISPQTSVTAPGYVGTQLTLSGDGFTASGAIIITYDGIQIATTNARTDGSFSATIETPISSAGEHIIIAADSSNSIEFLFVMESDPPTTPLRLKPDMDVEAEAEAFFDWQDVEDPSGVTYTLQIATDENFPDSSVVLEKAGLTLSEYTVTTEERLLSVSQEAPYYWRIRAMDAAGNASPWTDTGSFYVGSSFGISQGVIYTLIGVGALLLAAFAFWMGRKTAYY